MEVFAITNATKKAQFTTSTKSDTCLMMAVMMIVSAEIESSSTSNANVYLEYVADVICRYYTGVTRLVTSFFNFMTSFCF